MKKSDKHKTNTEEKKQNEKTKHEENAEATMDKAEDIQLTEVEKFKAEAEYYKDAFIRKAAEFENYKKRSDNEISNYIKYASENLIKSLLPVYDDINRAIESIEKEETKDFGTLKQGMQLIADKFKTTLKNEGLEEINILGKEFDVDTCDAFLQVQNDEVPPHTVTEVVEKGYKLKDKVIRFAKVIVSAEKE
ncbi:MAG: nucleotide exchange factor GrpE [Ignavibacteria bacterium]